MQKRIRRDVSDSLKRALRRERRLNRWRRTLTKFEPMIFARRHEVRDDARKCRHDIALRVADVPARYARRIVSSALMPPAR